MQKRFTILALVVTLLLLAVPLASGQGTTTVPPVCDAVYLDSTTVTGVWDEVCAGARVWVEDEDGNNIGESVVAADGTFVIVLTRSPEEAELLVVMTDCLGAAEPYPIPGESCQIVVKPIPPTPIPEPGTLVLLGSGLAGLAGYAGLRWRARK